MNEGRWLVLGNVFAMNFVVTGAAWIYVVVLVAPILADHGLALADWGLLWGGLSTGALLGSVPAGVLGDRYGVRRVVTLGALAMAGALTLRGVAPGFATLLGAMVLYGFTLSLVATNLPRALGLWFPAAELGMANGIALGGNGAGQGLAMYAAPLLVGHVGGWRGLTFALAAAVAVLALIWSALVRDRGEVAAASASDVFSGLAAALGIRDVWLLAGSYLFFLAGYLGIVAYLPTYLTTVRGLEPQQAGGMLTVVLVSYVVGSLILPGLSDRIGLRRAMYVPCIALAGAMVYASSAVVGAPLFGVMVVWGFAAGAIALVFVVPLELPSVGPAYGGAALGLTLMAGFLGGIFSPALGLWLAEREPLWAFAFWAGCYGLSALLFFLLPETGPGRRR
ncbi:MAG TPA: MFS transporter [Myxococcota bacterium]|nr:MFS transporter [Myxococcota bacterium]